jgi:hypothetical protein
MGTRGSSSARLPYLITSNPTYKVVSTCSRDTVKELTSRKPGK